ncbi:cyclic nucleotide-binding domain-containing protein [Candidatus Peregrinibacteria bacterium]|nr:cyclic nucleotide-binding domain-containing protein [Candidatus Peregrinibacteria bacterium]
MNSNLINLLKHIPILSDVDEDDLADVVKNTTSKTYKKGQYIIHEGEKGETFYIIESGKVQVLRKNDRDEEEVVAALYPDNFFGEMALLNEKPRNASIRCLEDCRVYVFKKKDFYSFLYL